ncbi:MAG: hypothetical protein WCX77_02035 [Candidatus Paceibacterota bacterium]
MVKTTAKISIADTKTKKIETAFIFNFLKVPCLLSISFAGQWFPKKGYISCPADAGDV